MKSFILFLTDFYISQDPVNELAQNLSGFLYSGVILL